MPFGSQIVFGLRFIHFKIARHKQHSINHFKNLFRLSDFSFAKLGLSSLELLGPAKLEPNSHQINKKCDRKQFRIV